MCKVLLVSRSIFFCWIAGLPAILCHVVLQIVLVWLFRIVVVCSMFAWQMERLSKLHRLFGVMCCLVVTIFMDDFSSWNVMFL